MIRTVSRSLTRHHVGAYEDGLHELGFCVLSGLRYATSKKLRKLDMLPIHRQRFLDATKFVAHLSTQETVAT